MKKYITLLFLAGTLGLMSCNDKLYSDPLNSLTQDQILEVIKRDPTKVLGPMISGVEAFPGAAGTSIVSYMNIKVFNLIMDLRGNDMVQVQANGGWLQAEYRMEDFGFRNETADANGYYWQQFYAHVYKANQVLDLIPDFDEVSNPDALKLLKGYKASALTLRAYAYTYLMWIYQDDYLHGGKDKPGVPLYLSVGEPQDRAPSQEVWNRIITDASEAVSLFNEVGIDPKAAANDFDATVANVVLARAAITIGDWTTAINAAKAVIDVYPELMDETQYTTKGFADLTLNEVILGYDYNQAKQASTSSFHGWMNITNTGGYGGSQGGWFGIDQRLYDQISNTDYRKKNFLAEPQQWTYVGFSAPVTHPKYSNYKFSAPAKSETTPDYEQDVIYMRVSEMILLKAEAEARSGNDGAAQATLYTLAHARDPQYVQSTKTGDALLKEIQLQTRIELWGEGFEYYNNKRWNLGVDRSGSANHTFFPVLEPGKLFTYQIPLNNELNYNTMITEQNPL